VAIQAISLIGPNLTVGSFQIADGQVSPILCCFHCDPLFLIACGACLCEVEHSL
jgi:hypothetical protein